MSEKLRVLHLEDDQFDANLTRALLAEEGIACEIVRVATKADFLTALSGPVDLILADFTPPGFAGLTALAMVRVRFPDLPFIFVTGTMGEEAAIEAFKRGASDYVIKSRLSRLAPAIRRALTETKERSERRRADEAQARENQLRHLQKMEALATLSGGIAHDFNNILTCINGYGQMLSARMAADDQQRIYVDSILEAAGRAAKLTSDLQQFSKKHPGEQKPLDLNMVIQAAEISFTEIIGNQIEVIVKLHDQPLPVLADGNALKQVLINLTSNARDAMSEAEKGCYTISSEAVTLKSNTPGSPCGDYALLTIVDNGEGMTVATQERIFEPFFTTREVGKGTGLGLATVYGIIKQHNGEIRVSSEINKGTSFSIYLPLIATAAEEKTGADRQEVPCGGTETILLAEDDPQVRAMATSLLADYGYNVLVAESGLQAVDIFEKNQGNIDLLFFDLLMPGMNGLEACAAIEKLHPGMKALIASGFLPEGQGVNSVPGNRICVVEKPYQPRVLLQKVRSLLDGVRVPA
jgi:signal transduction histidine kinase